MNRKVKLLIILVGALCLAWTGAAEALDQVRIGVILPLTGRAASAGAGIKNGIDLAYEALTPALAAKVKVIYEDDASESRNSITAYRKFSADEVDLVVTAFSNAGHAVAPLAERDHRLHVAFALDPSISAGRTYSFTLWARVADLAALAVQECRRRGYKKIAAVVTSHEGNLAMFKALAGAAAGEIEIVAKSEVLPDDRDFQQAVLQLRERTDIDAVANLLHPAQMGVFARRAKQLGLTAPQFALSNFEDRAVVKDSAGALAGQWYAAADYYEQFVRTYRRAYPDSSIIGAAYGHDLLLLLAKLIQTVSQPAELAGSLRSLQDFNGALRHLSAGAGNTFAVGVTVKVVGQDGLQ